MIAISTQIADIDGFVIIDNIVSSEAEKKEARIQRTKLLDGTTSIVHYGVSDGDRTIAIKGFAEKIEAEKLQDIFDNQTFINLSADDGFYNAVLKNFSNDVGNISTTIYIKERV